MKTRIALSLLATALLVVLLRSAGVYQPTTTFDRADQIRLHDDHPTGTFTDDHTFRVCERGFVALYMADGSYLYTTRPCWK